MRLGKISFVFAACLAALFFTCAAIAQSTPSIEVSSGAGRGQVYINGKVALTFYNSNANLTPAERANITAQRIATFADSSKPVASIQAKGDKQSAKIMADTAIICFVTAADAKKNKSTPMGLATTWAKNIRTLLLMPPVLLGKNEIVVPAGERRAVSVGGTASGSVSVVVENTDVVTATVSEESREVLVQGIQPGFTTVYVSVNGKRASLGVTVKKYAGALIQSSLEATVTGDPCPKDVVQMALQRAVMRSAFCEPGAKVKILSTNGAKSVLAPGKSCQAAARVQISGPNYITYTAVIPVAIRNEYLRNSEPSILFYSNHPERVLQPQVLFAGRTSPEKQTRLLYHHQNDSGRKLRLTVEVVNFNLSPVVFRLFSGSASVSKNTVVVGYSAGRSFLENYIKNVSLVDPIPAQTRLTLISQVIANGETASGILELSQLEGEDAYVIVRASDPSSMDVSAGTYSAAPAQAIWNMSTHIYDTPSKVLEETFEVGRQWKFISVGKYAIQSTNSGLKLDGNYGVSYHINLKVTNPQSEKGKVSILFDATAGSASVISLINGQLVGEKYVNPPNEAHLASYTLEPGEERYLNIVFIPLAGSHYPAKIVVKS